MWQDSVKQFLDTPSSKDKVIVIYGPTASGKTDMSITLAKELGTEIISTDSRQIFRYMDIGTGKIRPDEMQGIPHHMIDIINPDESFSVGDFSRQAREIMSHLIEKNKTPLLVGGTGLYIDSLIFDFDLGGVPASRELREQFASQTTPELYTQLLSLDSVYAREIHPHNRPYIERGLEVKITTGKSKMEMAREKKLIYDVLFLTPALGEEQDISSDAYRKNIYERINTRVRQMLQSGLEQEVQSLLARGYTQDDFGLNSIGYKEFFPYFDGDIGRDALIESIQLHTRQYAKRQITWFKRYSDFFAESQ